MAFLLVFLAAMGAGVLSTLIVVAIALPTRYVKQGPVAKSDISVQVLVLGDIGRSPRMQYHALSIAKHGGRVDLIGYQETQPHPDLLKSPRVKIHPLPPPPSVLRSPSLPFLVSGPLKVIWQVYTLIRALSYETPPSRWLLVQNPPSIPTLAVALLVSTLRNSRLVVDWHNYGWSILANARGAAHPFVRVSKMYESVLGRVAPTANLTVTQAMARQLAAPPYSITAPILTLHDRPAAIFQPLAPPASDKAAAASAALSQRRDVLSRIPQTAPFAESVLGATTRLLVSSTSWTPDEDFGLLLDALAQYPSLSPDPTPLLLVITGKGPQRAHYEARIDALKAEGKLPGVRVATAWLSLADYAGLLAAADLGVCLHTSTSGVDLPMKVVDMFGAGLPVAAYDGYESFGELVREGENGFGFGTAEQLAAVLARLFGGLAEGGAREGKAALETARKGAVKEGSRRWDEEWDTVAGRLLGFVEEDVKDG